jgi:hypothetical protein
MTAKERPDLKQWYEKTRKRPDGGYQANYTFPGLSRSRHSLETKDPHKAAEKVREDWEILEHRARQERLRAEGLIPKEQANGRTEVSLLQALGRYMEEHGSKLPTQGQLQLFNRTLLEILGPDILLSEIGTP